MKQSIRKQDAAEGKALSVGKERGDSRVALPLFPEKPSETSRFHACRLLLSHLGFLSNENRKKFRFLSNNKRFQRSVKELDKING